jgi:hypothetical protein
MATANFYLLAKPLQPDQRLKQQNRIATGQASFAPPKAEAEPEVRLWKVCAEVASLRFIGLEWVAFLFFGALVLGALACCFSEVFQLLNSGALCDTVGVLLKK